MHNLSLLVLIGLCTAIILFACNTPEMSKYTTSTFSSGNEFVTVNPVGGAITLQPVADVDTAINNVSAAILANSAATYQPKEYMKNYQTKAAMASYQPAGVYQSAAGTASTFQPKGNYLDMSKTVYLQNADKGTNWFGAWGDRGGFYDNSTKSQTYNKWKFSQ